jgi:hypothetical protein
MTEPAITLARLTPSQLEALDELTGGRARSLPLGDGSTPNTTTSDVAARAIERWEAAIAGLELARQMVGDTLHGGPARSGALIDAEHALRIACGRVEAAGAELCVVAATSGGKG